MPGRLRSRVLQKKFCYVGIWPLRVKVCNYAIDIIGRASAIRHWVCKVVITIRAPFGALFVIVPYCIGDLKGTIM